MCIFYEKVNIQGENEGFSSVLFDTYGYSVVMEQSDPSVVRTHQMHS